MAKTKRTPRWHLCSPPLCASDGIRCQVFVDMAKAMEESGLAQFFPVEAWPEVVATSEIATKQKAMRAKCGHGDFFIYSELRKYVCLPPLQLRLLYSFLVGFCQTHALSAFRFWMMIPCRLGTSGCRRAVHSHRWIWPCGPLHGIVFPWLRY